MIENQIANMTFIIKLQVKVKKGNVNLNVCPVLEKDSISMKKRIVIICLHLCLLPINVALYNVIIHNVMEF